MSQICVTNMSQISHTDMSSRQVCMLMICWAPVRQPYELPYVILIFILQMLDQMKKRQNLFKKRGPGGCVSRVVDGDETLRGTHSGVSEKILGGKKAQRNLSICVSFLFLFVVSSLFSEHCPNSVLRFHEVSSRRCQSFFLAGSKTKIHRLHTFQSPLDDSTFHLLMNV